MPSHASTAAKVRGFLRTIASVEHHEDYAYVTLSCGHLRLMDAALSYEVGTDCRCLLCADGIHVTLRDPLPDIPTLTSITARPVDLNPAAWGEDDDAPACYVRGCGAIEDLEEAGFPGQRLKVCLDCRASYQHQEALRQEFGAEGTEP